MALVISNRSTSGLVIIQAAMMATIIGVAAAVGSPFALQIAPFAISLTFIAQFALSLRVTPIIERFARLQKPILPSVEVAYCRSLTKVWVGVLAINSCLLLIASICKDEGLWAILVGPVSYGLLGFVFTVEYIFRKWRFQDFNKDNPMDKLLKSVLERKIVQ
ncbi:MAG: hypothetical protein GY847_15255 [Proteobacteria bacterium]|nr:hypothetical protein [Pseudomonadota bacterium]